MSILDKMKEIKQQNESKSAPSVSVKTKGLFFKPQKENKIRFVGDFMRSYNHHIQNDNPILTLPRDNMFTVACLNWDYENQREIDGGCPICRLNKMYYNRMLKESDPAAKEAIKKLSLSCMRRMTVKWNVIDAADPFYIELDDTEQRRVRGTKIWRIPGRTYEDIEKMVLESEIDITDPDKGCWLKLLKEETSYNTKYEVKFIMNKGQIEFTPLTQEERSYVPHDLKQIRDYSLSLEELLEALRPDLREEYDFLVANESGAPAPRVAFRNPETAPEPESNPNLEPDMRVPFGDNPEDEKVDRLCFGKMSLDSSDCKTCSDQKKCMIETAKREMEEKESN